MWPNGAWGTSRGRSLLAPVQQQHHVQFLFHFWANAACHFGLHCAKASCCWLIQIWAAPWIVRIMGLLVGDTWTSLKAFHGIRALRLQGATWQPISASRPASCLLPSCDQFQAHTIDTSPHVHKHDNSLQYHWASCLFREKIDSEPPLNTAPISRHVWNAIYLMIKQDMHARKSSSCSAGVSLPWHNSPMYIVCGLGCFLTWHRG